jgi:hypothetical protein
VEWPVWVAEKQALWIFLKSPSSLLEHFIYSAYEKSLIIWILRCYQLTYQIFLLQITDNVFLYTLYPCSFPWEWLFGFTCIFLKGFCSYVNFEGHELKLSLYLHYRIFLQTKKKFMCMYTHASRKAVHSHSFDVKTGIPPIYRVET